MEDYLHRYWLPSASQEVIVGALSYSAIAEALKGGAGDKRVMERFRATCKTQIVDLMRKDMIVFPCKV